MLSSRGCVARKFTNSEHSIELVQLASHVVLAMHAETSNDDDPFAKVMGLISDIIARLAEKASADATHNDTSIVYTVVHRTDGLKTIAKRVQGVSQLFSFFDETYYPEDSEDRNDALHDHVTTQGPVSDDLDDFPRSRHHEIESHGVSRIIQLA